MKTEAGMVTSLWLNYVTGVEFCVLPHLVCDVAVWNLVAN